MKTVWILYEEILERYYACHRIDENWVKDIKDAYQFGSIAEIYETIQRAKETDWSGILNEDRVLSIKELLILKAE